MGPKKVTILPDFWKQAKNCRIIGGSTPKIYFWGGWLDNMSTEGSRRITVKCTGGVEESWPTVEHYFQAQKHPGPEGRIRVQEIKDAKSALQAKRVSYKPGGNFDADWWECVKLAVMYNGVRAKFSQHSDMQKRLIATKGLYIAEHCPDEIWGDGARNFEDDRLGPGKNFLGLILMVVRKELLLKNSTDEQKLWELPVLHRFRKALLQQSAVLDGKGTN